MTHGKFLRVYTKLDLQDVREHMLIFGDLTASCSKCNALDLKFEAPKCPGCQTDFKYISFRNVKSHMAKLPRIKESQPNLIIIDFEDYSRMLGALKAEEFWK